MWLLLLFSTLLSIATLSLYRGAGLSTEERILFNSIVNNYTGEFATTQALWNSLEPLELVLNNQSVTNLKNYDIPNIADCVKNVDSFMATLLTEAAVVDTAISAITIPVFQPSLTILQSMVSLLPQKLGLITVHTTGSMQWANAANETEFVNGVYRLESFNLDHSIELYYVRIPNLNYHLTISTPTTEIVMKDWVPPLYEQTLQSPSAVESENTDDIAILPGVLRFTRRLYDLPNGRIIWSTSQGNITAGNVVALEKDLIIIV